MSTALATSTVQQCFPWFQSDEQSTPVKRKNKSKSAVVASSVTPVSVAPVSVAKTGTPEVASQTNVVATTYQQRQPITLREGMRVGEVRIGDVMMSLLKSYGITDEEISQVLNTIALEQLAQVA